MENQLISFETAKLAKDKGFNKNTDWHVNIANEYHFGVHLFYPNNSEYTYDPENDPEVIEHEKFLKTLIKAPTQSLLQKWLREKHEIILFAQHETIDDAESAWTWTIKKYVPEGVEGTRKKKEYDFWKCHYSFSYENMMWWKTYEEALENGLQEALKLIK